MQLEYQIRTESSNVNLDFEPGTTTYFVGANGSGKTRLVVRIEEKLGLLAFRVSAHRALVLNPNVPKIREKEALNSLRTGQAQETTQVHQRRHARWSQKEATKLLNDFDMLLQVLFADQARVALNSHKSISSKKKFQPEPTKFERLERVWKNVLPNKKLLITGDDIQVVPVAGGEIYTASEMSDGERSVFYLVGQTLVAESGTLIIFDEPELHIHRSILSRLWDELEAERKDCAFLVVSHDLEFVASRPGSKVVLSGYSHKDSVEVWKARLLPEDTGFDEELVSLILGSRRPVLFTEGRGNGFEEAIYRAAYPSWTVIPRNSCDEVIHAVVTLRANPDLTRLKVAGIVDADGRTENEVEYLSGKGIAVLPVSEVENLFLLQEVALSILKGEGYDNKDATRRLQEIYKSFISFIEENGRIEKFVADHVRRRLDRILKNIDLKDVSNPDDLQASFSNEVSKIDLGNIAKVARAELEGAIKSNDIAKVLQIFDNKGALAFAAKTKEVDVRSFKSWLVRAIRNRSLPKLNAALGSVLPKI